MGLFTFFDFLCVPRSANLAPAADGEAGARNFWAIAPCGFQRRGFIYGRKHETLTTDLRPPKKNLRAKSKQAKGFAQPFSIRPLILFLGSQE